MKTACDEHVAECSNAAHFRCPRCGRCSACADGKRLARDVQKWIVEHPEAYRREE